MNFKLKEGYLLGIKIKRKSEANKRLEEKYEFRFYRYLLFILLILFSCIITVSGLINQIQYKKLVAKEVRLSYDSFFTYEIENSYKGLEYVYDSYSNEHNIPLEKLIAINIIYFGQDENRYLEPYIRKYIDSKSLSDNDKQRLYILVNKEVKKIEDMYAIKIMVKRFLPYILAIIFVTLVMWSIVFFKNRKPIYKLILGIIYFILGAFICYLSSYSLSNGILMDIAIVGSIGEFTIESGSRRLKFIEGAFLFVVLGIILITPSNKSITPFLGIRNNNLFLVDNLNNSIKIGNERKFRSLGNALLNEISKNQMIEINVKNKKIDDLLKDKNNLLFENKDKKENTFLICFYKDIPIYRFVTIKGKYVRAYEGVLNPYMRSIIIKLGGGERYKHREFKVDSILKLKH